MCKSKHWILATRYLQSFTWIVGESGESAFNNEIVFLLHSLIFQAWNMVLICHIKFGIFEGPPNPTRTFPWTYWGVRLAPPQPSLWILSCILYTYDKCKIFLPMPLILILFFQVLKKTRVTCLYLVLRYAFLNFHHYFQNLLILNVAYCLKSVKIFSVI